jgi:AcrR family transcriptional regulator
MKFVSPQKPAPCKRPYSLGKRLELSARKRTTILAAARAQLESNGFLGLTLDSLAREGGVTRQTIHNLFGTKAGLLEALFNQLAVDGGMHRIREVMQQTNAGPLLESFVRVFTDFWSKDRLFIRRIHGIAAIDSELGTAVEARNQRRMGAASRVVDRVCGENGLAGQEDKKRKITALYALTSFEFFDILAEASGSSEDAAQQVLTLVKKEFAAT